MKYRTRKESLKRRGFTSVELVVSSVILMTVMAFVTTLSFRVGLVWKDVRHQRIAVCELANQLEVLTLLSPDQAVEAIKNLQPSDGCNRTLTSPELKAALTEDELGTRISLSINWKRRIPGKPIELSGWIISKPTAIENEASDIETPAQGNGGEKADSKIDSEPASKVKSDQEKMKIEPTSGEIKKTNRTPSKEPAKNAPAKTEEEK